MCGDLQPLCFFADEEVGGSLDNGKIFYYQLLGVVSAGSFIGEFWRTRDHCVDLRSFLADFLAGAFLSFLIAWGVFSTTHNRTTSTIVGGLLAFQDREQIVRVARIVLTEFLHPPKGDKEL